MADTRPLVNRVPHGVVVEDSGVVEASPFYLWPLLANDEPTGEWVLENTETGSRRLFTDWRTAYRRLLKARVSRRERRSAGLLRKMRAMFPGYLGMVLG